jgi:hypothetical protein
MLRKLIGTLTFNILNSMHISISSIVLYKSCSVATPKHSEPLLLENYVYIVVLTPDLRRVFFYNATELLYYSSTIKFLLALILMECLIRALRPYYYAGKSSSALWLLGRLIHGKLPRGLVLPIKQLTIFVSAK